MIASLFPSARSLWIISDRSRLEVLLDGGGADCALIAALDVKCIPGRWYADALGVTGDGRNGDPANEPARGPDGEPKRRRTGDVFRFSNVQNIGDEQNEGFFMLSTPKPPETVRGPKAKVRRGKRIESRRVHPGRMSLNLLTENRTQLHVTDGQFKEVALCRVLLKYETPDRSQNSSKQEFLIDWLFVSQWRLTERPNTPQTRRALPLRLLKNHTFITKWWWFKWYNINIFSVCLHFQLIQFLFIWYYKNRSAAAHLFSYSTSWVIFFLIIIIYYYFFWGGGDLSELIVGLLVFIRLYRTRKTDPHLIVFNVHKFV